MVSSAITKWLPLEVVTNEDVDDSVFKTIEEEKLTKKLKVVC